MPLLEKYKAKSFDPDTGKGFAYVYSLQNNKFNKTIEKVYDMFSAEGHEEGILYNYYT